MIPTLCTQDRDVHGTVLKFELLSGRPLFDRMPREHFVVKACFAELLTAVRVISGSGQRERRHCCGYGHCSSQKACNENLAFSFMHVNSILFFMSSAGPYFPAICPCCGRPAGILPPYLPVRHLPRSAEAFFRRIWIISHPDFFSVFRNPRNAEIPVSLL